ncbi:hypothetical protein INT46_005462 [Mucor plumbeus]|uniref:Transposase n=1 Tax=Mucor plumbeus TaxID=97098 RepID=A0A8H7UV54_9FUNG|nr:hypothetical protein INT46_005462 [Mucor plumbeus]
MQEAGVSKSTVYCIKYEIGQTFQRLKPGKPSSITETTKNTIKLKLRLGKLCTAEDTHKFLNNLGHPIGYEATRNLQHRLGFNCSIVILKKAAALEFRPSPDLNPIEHVWYQLKRRPNAYPTRSTTKEELEQRIATE